MEESEREDLQQTMDASAEESSALSLAEQAVQSMVENHGGSIEQPGAKAKKKKSKAPIVWLILIALLAVVGGVLWLLYDNYVLLGDPFGNRAVYPRHVTEADLSGSDIQNFTQLSRMDKLECIDLTNTAIDDIAPLYGCKSLKQVIMKGRSLSADECIAFYEALPDAVLICDVAIGDEVYDSQTQELTMTNADDAVIRSSAALHQLQSLDLTGVTVADETYDYLAERLPDCEILRMVELDGTSYRSNVKKLTLGASFSAEQVDRLKYFPQLTLVDALRCTDAKVVEQIGAAYPQMRVNRAVSFLDKTVGSEDELIDLRGNTYTLDQVKSALSEHRQELQGLKKIDMCGCGLKNQQMEELCDAYPDIKFVWIVKFRRWAVRTDAVVFSSLNSNEKEVNTDSDYALLFKYCRDLRGLDLGHSLVRDISPITNMKNMRAVIFTDTKITDITPFAELPDLEFIEMNVNRVKSVEPLRNLDKLQYINLYSSKAITDLSPLYHHDALKLCIFHRTIEKAERERFKEANPNCETYYRVDSEKITTNEAWRTSAYRKKMKYAFKNWKYVVGFDEETGNYIFDFKTDQYKYQ